MTPIDPQLDAALDKILLWFIEDHIDLTSMDNDSRETLDADLNEAKSRLAAIVAEREQRITFDSIAGEWIDEKHVRPIFAIQNGKIIHTWHVSDDELRGKYGGTIVTQEHIQKYGISTLRSQQKGTE